MNASKSYEQNHYKRDNKFNGKKNFKQNIEKFKPNFKKKVSTWKQIDNELTELLPKYEQVN
jgi:protein involved in sex pheromone biosynthesis